MMNPEQKIKAAMNRLEKIKKWPERLKAAGLSDRKFCIQNKFCVHQFNRVKNLRVSCTDSYVSKIEKAIRKEEK